MGNAFWRDDHSIRLTLLGISLTMLYLTILCPLGFLESARLASSDTFLRWRNRLSSLPKETQEFLLVPIDDDSQRRLHQKWPWDRSLFADFLRKVSPHRPRLVLFDLAFSGTGRPESDLAFAEAVREGPPTLLAAYLNRQGEALEIMLPFPQLLQTGALLGLIDKPLDTDRVIRRMWAMPLSSQPGPIYPIEIRAAAFLQKTPMGEIRRRGTDLFLGTQRVPTSRFGESILINYLVSPEDIPAIPFWRFALGDFEPSSVRDKILLVGATSEIIHDIHPTPLGRLPGIVIEANGILTLITQRSLRAVPLLVTFPLALFFVIGILQLTYRMPLPIGLLVALVGIALATAAGLLLTRADILVESLSPVVLGSLAWFTGFVYKYLGLVFSAFRLQRQAITDGLTQTFTSRYLTLRLQEESRRLRLGKRPLSLLLIQVAAPSQHLMSEPWEKAQVRMREVAESIKRLLGPKGLIGRLQEDRFGLLLLHASLSQANALAEKIRQTLRQMSGESALGLASTEQPSVKTGEALLLCAEKALNRARKKGPHSYETFDPNLDQLSLPTKETTDFEKKPSFLEYVSSEWEERNRALEKALTELRQAHEQLESAFLEVTKSLVMALETKDAYTAGHLERVCRYSTRLAEALNLPKEEIQAVREAALLHDIGKIGLPDQVLHKVGTLTDEEREVIKQHLALGARILEPMKFFKSITTLIYHHHEWYNGKGYPHGLAGDFIPAGAQVIAIADAFDAMTTHRGYNKPMTIPEALSELKKGAGIQFNPLFVERFVEVITREGPQLAAYAAA